MAFIEYMCRYCGLKKRMAEDRGKPDPGRCPRKTGDRPHTWIKNRKL